MLYVPYGPGFQKVLYGPAAARPAAAYGATVTPATNAKTGAYAQLISGASLTDDVYGIYLNFNNGFFAAEARPSICDIGIDPAGGTTYSVLIADLLTGNAGTFCADREANLGINYYFPLFIKSGTSVGCRCSVNHATVRTIRCQATFYCKPKHPEAVKVGSFVESLGVTLATSSGTAVTSGQASEGAWTSLGTTTKPTWYHQSGFSNTVLIASNLGYFADLSAGAAGGELLLENDTIIATGNNDDSAGKVVGIPLGGEIPGSTTIWGRLQCSGTPDASSMMAYCLGG